MYITVDKSGAHWPKGGEALIGLESAKRHTTHSRRNSFWNLSSSKTRLIPKIIFPYCNTILCLFSSNDGNSQKLFFSKTGHPSPHIARVVQTFLGDNFGDERIISRFFPFAWPPRSPDVAPPDYWLWGILKSTIYKRNPTSIEELKAMIRKAVSEISAEELKKAVHNLVPRLHALLHNNGGHFEHLM